THQPGVLKLVGFLAWFVVPILIRDTPVPLRNDESHAAPQRLIRSHLKDHPGIGLPLQQKKRLAQLFFSVRWKKFLGGCSMREQLVNRPRGGSCGRQPGGRQKGREWVESSY
ncbi:MAG TPA: hypothetical protein VGZ25_00070, partial [Gemmataceae bacterium]|nr:hypothetical protein [Gemmataceae bacterium]